MQAQSMTHAPAWMRFYEHAQALGAFRAPPNPGHAPAMLEPQALSVLKNLFDRSGIATAQPHLSAEV